jgi:hypothetical protein
MTISVSALSLLVSVATLITAAAPVLLVVFWLTDWIRGRLW